MHLETDRLIIRDWNPRSRGDVMGAFAMYSDPEVLRYFPMNKIVTSMKEMRENLKKNIEKNAKYPPGQGFWAVEEKAEKRIVGAALLKPLPDNQMNLTADIEVGWHLRRDAWGKGFATEMGRALLQYGFEDLKLPEIYALISPENLPSIKVAQRLNMKPLGIVEKYVGLKAELFRTTAAEWNS